ncbi:hypothetical protein MMC11_005459, partial [Xylographa trunciseda]|nr:hypothetical protein [Xylographa trunciseda]
MTTITSMELSSVAAQPSLVRIANADTDDLSCKYEEHITIDRDLMDEERTAGDGT